MKAIRFLSWVLLVAFVCAVGCATEKPTPDPLAGWKEQLLTIDSEHLNKAIKDDTENYIQSLPPSERQSMGVVFFYEDGTGQYAVRFQVALNGIDWAHVLIYDKENKRIKVIKYEFAHYRS